jgi:hypothetical protein
MGNDTVPQHSQVEKQIMLRKSNFVEKPKACVMKNTSPLHSSFFLTNSNGSMNIIVL